MKIKSLALSVLASIFLFACSNDDDSAGDVSTGMKSVSVSISGLKKKANPLRATAPVDTLGRETKDVNSILINLTDNAGNILATKTVMKDETVNSDWDKLIDPDKGLKFINVSESVSKVVVYGNPGTAVNGNQILTDLADQQGSEVLYYGIDEDLTPIVPEPVNPDPTQGMTYTAKVSIKPIVARLQIKKISFQESGQTVFTREINGERKSATINWTGFNGTLKGVYLNDFYDTYQYPRPPYNFLSNSTFENHIVDGEWLFDSPATNATEYASYSNFVNGEYVDLPLSVEGKCYAFNFFPGLSVPVLHLDIANIAIGNITSTDEEVFNPLLVTSERFCNIFRYYKNGNEEMVASDFIPGTLYNLEINIIPVLDNDLSNIQYNVLVHVTIEDWEVETIIPGFNVDQ